MLCYNCQEKINTEKRSLGHVNISDKDCLKCGTKVYLCQYCYLTSKTLGDRLLEGECLTCKREEKLNILL